jgi:hypothetical protein
MLGIGNVVSIGLASQDSSEAVRVCSLTLHPDTNARIGVSKDLRECVSPDKSFEI